MKVARVEVKVDVAEGPVSPAQMERLTERLRSAASENGKAVTPVEGNEDDGWRFELDLAIPE